MLNSIVKEKSAKYVENRSKFFSYIFLCDSEEKRSEILKSIHSQHVGCTHVCFASVIDDRYFSSDDREPSGTAGAQIECVIRHNNLVNILIIVVRYFGGVKLGVQRLAQSYRLSSEMVVDGNLKPVKKHAVFSVSTSYDTFSEIQKIASKNDLKIFDEKFDDSVNFSIFLSEDEEKLLKDKCFLQKKEQYSYF